MARESSIGTLMDEVAAALPPRALVHFPAAGAAQEDAGGAESAGGCWALAVGGGQVVEMAVDSAGRCLVFAALAGRVDGRKPEAKLELMLRYNHLTERNGGFSLAVGPTLDVAVIYKHPLAGLDATWLLASAEGVARQRALWAELIALPVESDPQQVMERLPEGFDFA